MDSMEEDLALAFAEAEGEEYVGVVQGKSIWLWWRRWRDQERRMVDFKVKVQSGGRWTSWSTSSWRT